MLVDAIKHQMTRAMRDRDRLAKDILGLALGEIQTAEARANRALSDDEAVAVVRKLVKSNEESLSLSAQASPAQASEGSPDGTGEPRGRLEASAAAALRREIEVLSALLPKTLSVEAIAIELTATPGLAASIQAAKADGQAMGVAMKHLKASGAAVEAESVRQAVQRLRR